MNVYFNENYWGCARTEPDRIPGKEIRVEKEFTWDKRRWRIPSVYVCQEGIVVDFCVRIPAEEIEAFLKKWSSRIGELTGEEELCLEQENPFHLDMREEIWINGEKAEGFSGCGTSWIPPILREEEEARSASDIEEQMMEAYACDCRDGWKFHRISVSWPEGVREPVRSLTVRLKKEPVCYAGPHFRAGMGEEKKQVKFSHPVTGKQHVLTVQKLEQTETPGLCPDQGPGGRKILKSPTHLLVLFYTVEPELSRRELLIADCGESDPPVMERRTGAADVSIIGGADGPVAIFFAGKASSEAEQKNWQGACSSLHYEPVERAEWRMEFHVESDEEIKISISL